METIVEPTVRSIVIQDFRTASVFEKYGIDFCCHGNVPLSTACEEQGVPLQRVESEIALLESMAQAQKGKFDVMDIDELVAHIIERHHAYVRRVTPALLAHTKKIASVHEKNHPELLGVANDFQKIATDLASHMMKEERVLFPYLAMLGMAARSEAPFVRAPFGSAANPIRMMETEHESAGDLAAAIRNATREYQPPADACTTYRVSLQELQEFERDLHTHVHLENNILFPRALELEQRFL